MENEPFCSAVSVYWPLSIACGPKASKGWPLTVTPEKSSSSKDG